MDNYDCCDKKLTLAIDIVRHGDRTPLYSVPGITDDVWHEKDLSQLTEKGRDESKKKGKEFAAYYKSKNFLFDTQDYVQYVTLGSTNTQRTYDTAKMMNEGMFPEVSAGVDIRTFTTPDARCLHNAINGKSFSTHENDIIPEDFKKSLQDYARFIDQVFDKKYSFNPIEVARIGGILAINKIHNKPMPKGLNEKQVNELIDLYHKRYLLYWSIPARNCCAADWAISKILDVFQSKIFNESKKKYYLIVMHDINITPLLRFLRYPIFAQPPYNANIRFELLKNSNNEYYVKVSYNGENLNLCDGKLCSYKDFLDFIELNKQLQCNDFNVDRGYLEKSHIS